MAFFTKQITDPEEAYQRLIKKDDRVSAIAREEFVVSMDHGLIEFLYDKFMHTNETYERLAIIETYASVGKRLTDEDLKVILRLLSINDTSIREALKDVLLCLNESNLAAATNILTTSTDREIHKLIQFGIENSGISTRLLDQWNRSSLKNQILYIGELVSIQSPTLFPIFLDIMKENDIESEDKKVLQVEFTKQLTKLKSPDFMEFCIKELPVIAPSVRYPLFKSLQVHGKEFFEKFFDGLTKKSENIKLQSIKLIDQLVDPNSFPYLFPFLLDTSKQVPQTTIDAIIKIVKSFCDELESMDDSVRESAKIQDKIEYFVGPLVDCLSEEYGTLLKGITECLLRIGRYEIRVILENLPLIYKFSEGYFKNFLRGLNIDARKKLLIEACCYKKIETGFTALQILSDPSESYIIDTLNTLVVKHFTRIPKEVQSAVINMMKDPKLQGVVSETLNHKDPSFRMNVIQTLGESESPNAVSLIGSKIRDPEVNIREAILNILDKPCYKNTEALDYMLMLLSDINADLISKTIEKVQEYDDGKVIVALNKLLSTKNIELQKLARKAITHVTKRKYLKSFDLLNPEARTSVGNALLKLDPNFLEETTDLLSDSNIKIRVRSAQILDALYLRITPDLKVRLICSIQDPNPKIRAIIVTILGKIGGVSVKEVLLSRLVDEDARVRANTVEALLEVGDISIANKLVPCLYDPNNRVRGNAIMTLWKLGYYNLYNIIIDMFRSQDKWMRASVAYALGELKDIRFFPVLVYNLKDKDADVRRNVVKALAKLADPYTLAPYIRPLRFDLDENVRKEVSAALTVKTAKPVSTAPKK